MAAEYIVSSGNPNVILCERGIRTFETYTRNTLDLTAVPLLHHLTHLPVIVDPSHATGKRWLVKPLALGGGRRRRRRRHGRGPPATRTRPCPTASSQLDLRAVRRPDGRRLVPIHEQVRDAHQRPVRRRRPGQGRRGEQALSRWHRRRSPGSRPVRLERRAPARRAAAARRQVDQPPGAAPRRPGRGREPDRRRRRRRATSGSTAGDRRPLWARPSSGCATDGRTSTTGSSRRASTASREPDGVLDCGNSGTSLRLMRRRARRACRCYAILDGDDSLRRRPVARIIEPLRSMGAALHARRSDSLPPLTVVGRTPLRAIDYTTPRAERPGQVGDPAGRACGRTGARRCARRSPRATTRSGCSGRAASPVERGDEPGRRPAVAWTRRRRGARCERSTSGSRAIVSAAAFWLVAGAIHPDAELTLRGVGVNPTRRAVIDLLRRDGRRDRGAAARRARARRRRRRAAGRPRRPLERAPRPSTSARPRSPRPSTRSRSSAWPRRRPAARPSSAAPASCATRNRTASPASPPGCAALGAAIEVDGDDIAHRRRRGRSPAPRPTASTTTGWR